MRRIVFVVLLLFAGFSSISYADSSDENRSFDLQVEYNSQRDTVLSPISKGFLKIQDGLLITDLSLTLDPPPDRIMLINHDPEVTSDADQAFEWMEYALPDELDPFRFQFKGPFDSRITRIYYVLVYDDDETKVSFQHEEFEVGILTEVHL